MPDQQLTQIVRHVVKPFTPNEIRMLDLVVHHAGISGWITPQLAAEEIGTSNISRYDAMRVLVSLWRRGLVKCTGWGITARYMATPVLLTATKDQI